jgi:hypothetical protein
VIAQREDATVDIESKLHVVSILPGMRRVDDVLVAILDPLQGLPEPARARNAIMISSG